MRSSSRSGQKSSLQLRLGAWDDIATQGVSRTDRRSRNWLLYTTAAGSALAMATDAGAQNITHTVPNPAPTANVPATFGYQSVGFSVGSRRFDLLATRSRSEEHTSEL